MEYVETKSDVIRVGQIYGWFTVVAPYQGTDGRLYALADCACGTRKYVRADGLRAGRAISCGCYHRQAVTSHGLWSHPLFSRWSHMMARCYNPADKRYPRYGARGITVCERWHDPAAFVSDMAASFVPGLTLDRRDNDAAYSPDNCRWATAATQNRNYSRNIVLDQAASRSA